MAMLTITTSTLQEDPAYELIHMTDSTTETTGSVTLMCRDQFAEPVATTEVKFWLNRTSACDLDLRDRVNVQEIEVGSDRIKLNLTGNLEGNYSCGVLTVLNNQIIEIKESVPVTLICKS